MRIQIITDSLGMPRETCDIDDTWPLRVIKKYRFTDEVLFFPKRGRFTTKIVEEANDLLILPNADVFVIQVGIVDATRRPVPRKVGILLDLIPIINKLVRVITRKYGFLLTHMWDCKYVNNVQFQENIEKICKAIRFNRKSVEIIFISIAPPGDALVRKVYNVENDVKHFNQTLNDLSKKLNFIFCQPYKGVENINFFLEVKDGHHLNQKGHERVFKCVDSQIQAIIEEQRKERQFVSLTK